MGDRAATSRGAPVSGTRARQGLRASRRPCAAPRARAIGAAPRRAPLLPAAASSSFALGDEASCARHHALTSTLTKAAPWGRAPPLLVHSPPPLPASSLLVVTVFSISGGTEACSPSLCTRAQPGHASPAGQAQGDGWRVSREEDELQYSTVLQSTAQHGRVLYTTLQSSAAPHSTVTGKGTGQCRASARQRKEPKQPTVAS